MARTAKPIHRSILPEMVDTLTPEQHAKLTALCTEIGTMLGTMINNPAPFLISDHCPLISDF